MYDLSINHATRLRRVLATIPLLAAMVIACPARGQESLVRHIEGASDKLEITTNTSRILTLGKKIPKVQVNNPDLLAVTPLSATEIQVSAKKAGVTQVNLWDEDGQIHTVDVFIYGDVRELEHALATQFPNSAIKVYRYSQSLVLTGFIDRPDYVDPIRQLAEDYAPKVINNIAVGGVQQVLLKVKIYEVARGKLRRLGVDFAHVSSSGAFVGSSVSGLLSNITPMEQVTEIVDTGGQTAEFLITNGGDALLGWLDALTERDIAKILAEPNIVAVSGRPAQFNEGGEIPIVVPQSLGQVAIEYKPFGTQVDFLPIVLGNGKIRLEVRPRISDLDFSNAVTIDSFRVPALTVRQVDTAVEMNAGQTFALAGLIQQRTTTVNRGVPLLADIPVLGVPFRRVEDNVEEVELLILVTPEFVDAMDPHEVPTCGPGMGTVSPRDADLYIDGTIEVPNRCGPCVNGGCGSCPACVSGGAPNPPIGMINNTGAHVLPPQAYPASEGTPTLTPTVEPLPTPSVEHGPMQEETSLAPTLQGPSFGATTRPPHYQPTREQPLVRQAARPYQPVPGASGLIGPVGYDEE